MVSVYAADFESTTSEDDCRVWAWGITDIANEKSYTYGNSIETFIDYISSLKGTIYFHNLKFDGGFILDHLFRNGYEWTAKRWPDEKTFSTLISDMGMWYSIRIRFEDSAAGFHREVEILDSLKVLPMKIEDMPKSFGIECQKLEIDYKEDRPKGHILTEEEQAYLKNDVIILARALKFLRENGQNKMTTGANALHSFQKMLGKKDYERMFPALSPVEDADIRKSYKGGFTYLNPKYREKTIGSGCVYDVNSMYPWAMKFCELPYGEPIYYSGEYKESKIYPLYVQCILCEFQLKSGRIPSIQIKNNFRYLDTEYLTCSDGPTFLYLTKVDYELFLHNYDVKIHSFEGGYMFHGKTGIFAEYIDYWYEQKDIARSEGNKGKEKIAKLMLNSLYGKFGGRLTGKSKIPYLDEEQNKVRYYLSQEESRRASYVPVATFITAYCRDNIIRSAEKCGERFVYADTDSLHIAGTEPPNIDIDNHRLGAFKLESIFEKAKFIRQKTYFELTNGSANIKCAGMPENIKKGLSFEQFRTGAIFEGKLMPKTVPGGVILRETTFEIKKAKGVDVSLYL